VSAGEFAEFRERLEQARKDLTVAAEMVAQAQRRLWLLEKLAEKLVAELARATGVQ
jgi:hypothetical protein